MKQILLVLPILMALNIVLGAGLGWRKQEFDKEILYSGIQKIVIILIATGGLTLVAYLMPELSLIINGQEFTILGALYTLLFAEIAWYLKEVVEKLILVLASKSKDAVIEPVYDEGNYLRDDVGKG